jgi:hypothetical protein
MVYLIIEHFQVFPCFRIKLKVFLKMSLEVQNKELQMFFQTSKSEATKQKKRKKKKRMIFCFQILSLDPLTLTLETFVTHFEQKAFLFLGLKRKEKINQFYNQNHISPKSSQFLCEKLLECDPPPIVTCEICLLLAMIVWWIFELC